MKGTKPRIQVVDLALEHLEVVRIDPLEIWKDILDPGTGRETKGRPPSLCMSLAVSVPGCLQAARTQVPSSIGGRAVAVIRPGRMHRHVPTS